MTQLLNAKELKETASIVDLLARLGFEPVKKYGKEHMYRSMLRDGDSTPSFSVDDKLGAWYDHGNGKGGNIIDFGIAFWPTLNFNEVVEKIQRSCNVPTPSPKIQRPRLPVKARNYIIEQLKPIGTHPAITNYLQSRAIFDMAKTKLKEVYYHVKDEKGSIKQFFAAGWQNEAGSWEVRNKYFKGCLGNKAISFIAGDQKRVAVFEGFTNYLSWLKENPDNGNSVIVMNTLSLLNDGINKALQYSHIDLYLDRDNAGFLATKQFIATLPYATDKSILYEKFNDYNDMLVAATKKPGDKGIVKERSR
ncbi:toprim domain-containing protein [Mucilaginibacter rigui]|nr:toprim domain-containing protein [Mucilaginibacter rigui]